MNRMDHFRNDPTGFANYFSKLSGIPIYLTIEPVELTTLNGLQDEIMAKVREAVKTQQFKGITIPKLDYMMGDIVGTLNDRDIIVIKGGKLAYVDTGGLVPDNLIPEIKIGSIAAELEEIAGSFGQFKCEEAVEAMKVFLKKKKKNYATIYLKPENNPGQTII